MFNCSFMALWRLLSECSYKCVCVSNVNTSWQMIASPCCQQFSVADLTLTEKERNGRKLDTRVIRPDQVLTVSFLPASVYPNGGRFSEKDCCSVTNLVEGLMHFKSVFCNICFFVAKLWSQTLLFNKSFPMKNCKKQKQNSLDAGNELLVATWLYRFTGQQPHELYVKEQWFESRRVSHSSPRLWACHWKQCMSGCRVAAAGVMSWIAGLLCSFQSAGLFLHSYGEQNGIERTADSNMIGCQSFLFIIWPA